MSCHLMSETKENIDKGFISNVDLSSYHMYTQPSRSAAGGVAIYVNDKLDHISKDNLNIIDDDFEAVWIEIKNKKSKNIVCGCVYRHPNRDPTKFFEYLESTFAQLNKEKQSIFIMGDFDFDLLQYETHNLTNDFITTVTSNSFISYVLQPTRVTDHSSTVIDNIFSNITDFETTSGNITTMIADHFSQFLIVKKFHVNIKSNCYFTYDYSKFGKEKFINDFALLDWSDLDDRDKSINHHFENFYNKSLICVHHHLPKLKVSKKRLKLKTKPWITAHIIKLMTYRDNLLKKLNENFTVSNKYLYNKFRNRVVSEQRKSKKKYFHDFFQRHQSNIKMLWSGTRSIVNIKNKSKLSLISQLKYDGTCVNDPPKIGNIFNNYFVNVGPNIDKTIPRTKNHHLII